MIAQMKQWARVIKRDVHAIYLASRDPRVSWYAKTLAIAVAAYALSPIDLIPDFIPVLGYLDDLTIVPLGISLVVKLIPPDIMAEHRELATAAQDRPVNMVRQVNKDYDILSTAVFVTASWRLFFAALHQEADGFEKQKSPRAAL